MGFIDSQTYGGQTMQIGKHQLIGKNNTVWQQILKTHANKEVSCK